MVGTDAVLIGAAGILAMQLRNRVWFLNEATDLDTLVAPYAMVLTTAWLVSLVAWGTYNPKELGAGTGEYRRVFNASFTLGGLVGISAFLLRYPLSRGFFLLLFVVGTAALLLGRFTLRRLLHMMRRSGRLQQAVLVAGDLHHIEDITRILQRELWLGYKVVGCLPTGAHGVRTDKGLPILGTPGDVVSALTYTGATVVIFAEGSFPRAHMFNEMARVLENHHARMIVVPALSDISSQRMRVRPVAGMPLVHVEHPRATKAGTWAKRAFDIAGALLFITLAAPVMIATALAIKLEDGGPVFFKQKRVGRKGQEFNFIKFRSMRVDAEAQLQALSASNESTTGVLFKMAKDPRVTRVGRFIRRYSIDEIPQFVNVLRGDMSLVGPRPALPSEVRKYEVHVLRRLDVRPGMTGLWQVSGRSNLSWDDTVRLDLF